jgi:hypothetical protein
MSTHTPSIEQKPAGHFGRALLLTGLLAGTLDAASASTQFFLTTGRSPALVWKYVASAVFGPPAMKGGAGMVLLGLLFHYVIAFSFSYLYFRLYPRIPLLSRSPWLSGFLYALFVWVVTNLLLVPMTRVHQFPFSLKGILIGAGILVIAIGIPISLMVHNFYSKKLTA